MRILRKIWSVICRAAQWVDEHNREPRTDYLRNSYLCWMMSGVICFMAVVSQRDHHDWWQVPVALAGIGIPFGAGLMLYLQNRRAVWGIIGLYFFLGTFTLKSLQLWPTLTGALAMVAGVCCMMALIEAPMGVGRHHGNEPSDTRPEGSNSHSRGAAA